MQDHTPYTSPFLMTALILVVVALLSIAISLALWNRTNPNVSTYHDDEADVTCWLNYKGGIACLQDVPIQAK